VSPVKYGLCFYIPEEGILHNHRRDNLKTYIDLIATTEIGKKRFFQLLNLGSFVINARYYLCK
jgi:hypothetical protein